MIGEVVLSSERDDWGNWDDWDKSSGGGSGSANPPEGRTEGDDRWGTRRPPEQEEEHWGTRGGGNDYPPAPRNDNDPDVYTIRAVSEVPFQGMSVIEKLLNGKPLFANNQYNLQLQRSGSVGHGGGAVNGVIYGKIENQAISNGMKVRIRGRNKRGLVVIQRMFDVDSGNQEIYINHLWRDPLYSRRGVNPGLGLSIALIGFIIIAVLALLLAAYQTLGGGLDPSFVSKVKIVAAIAAVLVFIKVFNINIFNNSFVQKVLLLVGLVAVAIYVPGGDTVLTAAITLYAIYFILKSVF